MTVKEMKELINTLPDDAAIEINSIYADGEYELSPICEAHYDKNRNKVCITPTFLENKEESDEQNLKVCYHCLLAIESREGQQATLKHYIDCDDTETKCDWCQETADEGGFDCLYELI